MKPRRMSRTISPTSPVPLLTPAMARILPECKPNRIQTIMLFVLTKFSAAGLKAALHNPNVSDETKEHLQERLDDMN
jgi:hypothetical protein